MLVPVFVIPCVFFVVTGAEVGFILVIGLVLGLRWLLRVEAAAHSTHRTSLLESSRNMS
jgi:hypothetical protein